MPSKTWLSYTIIDLASKGVGDTMNTCSALFTGAVEIKKKVQCGGTNGSWPLAGRLPRPTRTVCPRS